jgi:hypothetical protein
LTVAPAAPTATVLPSALSASSLLNPSLAIPSEAVSFALNFAVVFQPLIGLRKT